jgi:preprotein translocase subunit YajC
MNLKKNIFFVRFYFFVRQNKKNAIKQNPPLTQIKDGKKIAMKKKNYR